MSSADDAEFDRLLDNIEDIDILAVPDRKEQLRLFRLREIKRKAAKEAHNKLGAIHDIAEKEGKLALFDYAFHNYDMSLEELREVVVKGARDDELVEEGKEGEQ